VETTYLLHLWVVLVMVMVRSWPHYLRHQWSQISTFASLNHIHHHTYLMSPHVHIQAFKSFLPRGLLQKIGSETDSSLATQFSSENLYNVDCTVRQRKLVRCRLHTLAAKTGSLPATQFDSENCFTTVITISAANATSLQQTGNSISATNHTSAVDNTTSAANADSLWNT
jgi:hypothetical protein